MLVGACVRVLLLHDDVMEARHRVVGGGAGGLPPPPAPPRFGSKKNKVARGSAAFSVLQRLRSLRDPLAGRGPKLAQNIPRSGCEV